MRVATALLFVALGCSHKESPLAEWKGSAGSATSDPWAKPAAPPACDDVEIKQHIADSLAVSVAYTTALEQKAAAWREDCDAVTRDLLALEPEAEKLVDSMQAFATWAQARGPACGKHIAELGAQMPQTREIDARMFALETKVTPVLERCKDHPGFADAAAKGLRVMHQQK